MLIVVVFTDDWFRAHMVKCHINFVGPRCIGGIITGKQKDELFFFFSKKIEIFFCLISQQLTIFRTFIELLIDNLRANVCFI